MSYQRLVNVSFKIDLDLLRELDEYARRRGMDRSEVIRRAIAWYLRSFTRPSVTPRITVYDAGSISSSNNASTSRIRIR
jgi:metal-responsive CopG/Arc/MetJ family transcriptional regulator